MVNKSDITLLKQLIKENPTFVLLSGAGVSTASGIPDFRSENGLYKRFKNAEYLLSVEALIYDTEAFFDFYKHQMLLDNIKPNIIHTTLAKLEKEKKMGAVITQNIDGLHTLAGSKNVIELHGTVYKNYCMKCGKEYPVEYIKKAKGIPRCSCGGVIRPKVVLYGESLHEGVLQNCQKTLNNTDLLIVAGTGLSVSTAAGIFSMFRGKNIVILNKEPTPYDSQAKLVMRDDLVDIFTSLRN
ncbi:MAG: NAD-dependent protein deacylase [Mycoplasmataceae bacterium]|jgi:NAD-dependent deacetylase|nr:NAD-dependent protein deacylase [Mycoplasmataceae bacterium]